MSRWNHSICEECWKDLHPEGRDPVKVIEAERENCCFCSKPHNSGIYVRQDPATLTCNGEHK